MGFLWLLSVSGPRPSRCTELLETYLWLVGNGGMGYNYNYYYYHSSIPYSPKVGKLQARGGACHILIPQHLRLEPKGYGKGAMHTLRVQRTQ